MKRSLLIASLDDFFLYSNFICYMILFFFFFFCWKKSLKTRQKMSEVIEQSNRNHRILAIMAGVFGGLAIGFTALTIPFITPAFRRIVLPFVPATNTQIENVLKAIEFRRPFESPLTKELKIIDLGSGDGRVVSESGLNCAKPSPNH